MSAAIKDKRADDQRSVMVFVQDEARFGRITSVGRSWAPLGIRPTVKQQMIRSYMYAFTAACHQTGESCSLVLPNANVETMQIFLNEVSECFPNYFIVMQMDQAGWHTSQKLKLPENIRIICQPSGSPETNPVENIWDYVKENDFRNRFFHTMEDVENQLLKSLEKLRCSPEIVKSIISFPHLNIKNLNTN